MPSPSPAPRYRAFLSASVRPQDETIVNSFVNIFRKERFDCFTVGRNVSAPESTAETAKREMQRCECLVVVATARFDATDVHSGNVTRLASGWIDGEGGMAHMRGIPITVFKARDVQLQGLLGANITQWFEFDLVNETLLQFVLREQVKMQSHFAEVRRRVDAARARSRSNWLKDVAKVAVPLVLGGLVAGAATSQEDESEYPCFGTYDGRVNVCRECPVKARCKKLRDARR
jgi:hypothetical protein